VALDLVMANVQLPLKIMILRTVCLVSSQDRRVQKLINNPKIQKIIVQKHEKFLSKKIDITD